MDFHIYDTADIKLEAIFTDNGCEFCRKLKTNAYEPLLSVRGIKHRTTKVCQPYGSCAPWWHSPDSVDGLVTLLESAAHTLPG